jgi:predicted nucleic acid-binding protein
MKIIVDSNIVFSAMLDSKNNFYTFFQKDKYKFYTCNFLFIEIFKYKERISKFSKLLDEEILNQLEYIFSKINFVNENVIPENTFIKAKDLCKTIDDKDTPFVALTIFLNGTLLTGDKKLISGLKGKGFTHVIELKDLIST